MCEQCREYLRDPERRAKAFKYQEERVIREERKPAPEKPVSLQIEEKKHYLRMIIPMDEEVEQIFDNDDIHLVFMDTERIALKTCLENLDQISFFRRDSKHRLGQIIG